MNVQAIETFYKGYRFRSRLEARWAVFFETLGMKWQYEVEGFELPSGRYLPDFYLPDYKCYFEVKPPPAPASYRPSVYMAGRMGEPCWRTINTFDHDASYSDIPMPRPEVFFGRPIIYTGPFRTDLCNHSFLHGLDGAAYCGEPDVFRRSVIGIKTCEVFFAYFEDLEAFGTLVELGMAHALGKQIVVGFTDNARPERWVDWSHCENPMDGSNDLWFAANCTDAVFTGDKNKVLKQFGDWLEKRYPVPREVALAKDLHLATSAGIYIVYGDAVQVFSNNSDGRYIRWGECIFDNDDEKLFISPTEQDEAALKARQARFEFGQTPV